MAMIVVLVVFLMAMIVVMVKIFKAVEHAYSCLSGDIEVVYSCNGNISDFCQSDFCQPEAGRTGGSSRRRSASGASTLTW